MRSGVIALLSPTAEQTDFLRACLWSGAEAQAAWRRWHESVGDARQALITGESGSKALVSLLHEAVRRNALAVDATVRRLLTVAALAEERRGATYEAICDRAFAALSAASVPFLVLKGTALATTVYPSPWLRHSHDIDLLVHSADVERCAAALSDAGFAPVPSPVAARRFLDESDLPLELHVGICRLAGDAARPGDIWERAIAFHRAAAPAATLSAADHLVHVLCQASRCGTRDMLTWTCDAFYLISGGLDWNVFLHAARQSAAELPLAGLLQFLAVQLRAPVPDFALRELAAARPGVHDAVLDGIRAGRRGRLRAMFGEARINREYAALLRWAFRRWRRRVT